MTVTFTWLGHSAFSMDIDGHSVLFDPFLSQNPLAAAAPDDLNPEIIFVSHAHGDHVGDTVAIAQRTGAHIVCNAEMSYWFQNQGITNVTGQNSGGEVDYDYLLCKFTPAIHSSTFDDGSSGGNANGFVITALSSRLKLYFAGDTALFSDMGLIGDLGIDAAFLPIGDHYTMGIDDSIRATQIIKPRYVIPMHYNTFPYVTQNVVEWANRISSDTPSQPIVLDPGGSHTIERV